MNNHATRARTTITAIFCLMFIGIVLGSTPSQANAQSQPAVFEFPLGRANPVYTKSMNIVLGALGQGQNRWVLHSGTNYFNTTVGCLEKTCGWGGENYPVLWFDGVETSAPGACDVASYFMYVAEKYGLSWDRTRKHGRALYGVSERFWVSIWNPGQDAWVVNPYTHDIQFVWTVEGTTLKIWMEGLDGSAIPPMSESLQTAIKNGPVDTSMDGEFILDSSSQQTPVLEPVTTNWEPQNDIAIINARYPSIKTGYVETTYPYGIAIHHTVGTGGGDPIAASAGAHPNDERVPYLIVIGKDGIARLISEFGSRTNHARCWQYGVEGRCPNTDYASIAVVGDYRYDTLTPAQEDALVNSIRWLIGHGAAPVVLGHRDVGKLNGYATICPGDNIYNKLPEILARANASGPINGSAVTMEGEFIVDPSYYEGKTLVEEVEFGHEDPLPEVQPTLQPAMQSPQVSSEMTDTLWWVIMVILSVIVIGVLIVGGVMVITSASDRNRPAAIAIVILVWTLACAVVAGLGYYFYTTSPKPASPDPPTLSPLSTPTIIPTATSLPDEFVGTGGDIATTEYVWDMSALDATYTDSLTHPVIPYTTSGPLSPVFWKFAVGQLWGDQIPVWSAVHGLDPNLVATFMLIESGGNPLANCPGDKLGYDANTEGYKDKGLFQLNPKYFQGGCDFDTNVFLGPQYIRSRMDAAGGNLAAAAAGYNGGPKALEWFLASSDPSSSVYQQKRSEYIVFLNALGYNGASKASIVEGYVKKVVGVYSAVTNNQTLGLEVFLAPGSYAGSVAKAYGLQWPPVLTTP